MTFKGSTFSSFHYSTLIFNYFCSCVLSFSKGNSFFLCFFLSILLLKPFFSCICVFKRLSPLSKSFMESFLIHPNMRQKKKKKCFHNFPRLPFGTFYYNSDFILVDTLFLSLLQCLMHSMHSMNTFCMNAK